MIRAFSRRHPARRCPSAHAEAFQETLPSAPIEPLGRAAFPARCPNCEGYGVVVRVHAVGYAQLGPHGWAFVPAEMPCPLCAGAKP